MPMLTSLEVAFRVPAGALSDQVKRRRVNGVCSTTVSVQQVPNITILGVVIDCEMKTHVDVESRIVCWQRAFWFDKRCSCYRDMNIIRRLRRCDCRV